MSNKNIIIAMLIVLVAAVAVTLFVAGHDAGSHAGHIGHTVTISSEREFIEHMIPHHQEAVTSSEELLSGEVRLRPVGELARAIVSAQNEEIEMMKGWYSNWYKADYADNGGYQKMMRGLSGVSAPEREKMYLEDMIMHHEMAIDSASQVLRLSISQETKTLAENILLTQAEEVRMMKELLKLQPK